MIVTHYSFLLILFIGCSNFTGFEQNLDKPKSPANNNLKLNYLDSLLSLDVCRNQFIYNEGVFYYPDYGCIYDSTNQKIGNAHVFLIPKSKTPDFSNEQETLLEEERLNSSSVEKIKQDFQAIVFLVESKFLHRAYESERLFNPVFPYKELCFMTNEEGHWKLENSYEINSSEEEGEMNRLMWEKVNKLK